MPVRLMSGLTARVSLVLQDFMPAELLLIDAEEADGITTPPIPVANYIEWDAQKISQYPACSIRTVQSDPLDIQANPAELGVWAAHRIDLMFHATYNTAIQAAPTGDAAPVLQKLMHRYVAAGVRVLALLKPGLEASADPVRRVEIVSWIGSAVYGPEADQEDGAMVRTATIPLAIRRSEIR